MSTNKILYTATSDIHLKIFHLPYLRYLKEIGFEVHLAFEDRAGFDLKYFDKAIKLPFKRSPFSLHNKRSYSALKSLIIDEQYTHIHCHTPVVSVITRLAARTARKNGTKVLFTSHGFHFFKGSGLLSWLVYYPIEKFLSKYTDGVITINDEDYQLAQNSFLTPKVFKINGMGVDQKRFYKLNDTEKAEKRLKMGFSKDDFIILVIGELNDNKNQEFILNSLSKNTQLRENFILVFLGKGKNQERLTQMAEDLPIRTKFLGWHDQVDQYAQIADLGISASKREGLGIALIEQMLCGVPILASSNRGHREIIDHGQDGSIFPQNDSERFNELFDDLTTNQDTRHKFIVNGLKTSQRFVLDNSLEQMAKIYSEFI